MLRALSPTSRTSVGRFGIGCDGRVLRLLLDVVRLISPLLLSASSKLGCQIQVHRSMPSPGRSCGMHSLTLCNTQYQGERVVLHAPIRSRMDFSLRNQSSITLGDGLSDRLVCPKSISLSLTPCPTETHPKLD